MNDMSDMVALWSQLYALAADITQPWLILGDFNAIMAIEDKIGSLAGFSEIQDMRNCMTRCNLNVIKTLGRQFTWSNKKEGVHRVFTRIDKVLANTQWDDLFPTTEAGFLLERDYDHFPMILSFYVDNA